jgi:hypothetical protein
MTKYLVSAAVAAVFGVAAFSVPASAQGVSIGIGGDRPYYGDRHHYRGHHSDYRPGVRVYTGRSAYRDDCYTKRTVKWRNGRKVVVERRICD